MANVHSFSKSNGVQLLLAPAAQGDTTTSYIEPFADGGGSNRAVFMFVIGAVTQDMDFSLLQAKTSAGGTSKAITGSAATTVTTATDNVVVTIEIAPSALDTRNGYKWVAATVDFASATDHVWGVVVITYRLRRPGEFTAHSTYAEAIEVS